MIGHPVTSHPWKIEKRPFDADQVNVASSVLVECRAHHEDFEGDLPVPQRIDIGLIKRRRIARRVMKNHVGHRLAFRDIHGLGQRGLGGDSGFLTDEIADRGHPSRKGRS